jgi:HEAT repeat protein
MGTPTILVCLALALAQTESERAIRQLIEKLRSDQVEQREESASRLKELGKPALGELDQAAKDKDPEVAGRALVLARFIRNREAFTKSLMKAFPKIEERLATGPGHEWTEAFLMASDPPWKAGAPRISLTREDLEPLAAAAIRAASTAEEKTSVCRAAERWELRIAIPELAELLADASDEVRIAASDALRRLKARESIPRVLDLLGHPDGGVRLRAVDLLPWLEAKESVPQVTKLLLDREGGVRGIAVAALAKLEGRPATRKFLLVLKMDPAPWVRLQAARALAEVRAPESLPVTLQLLDDKDKTLRKGALEILEGTRATIEPSRILVFLGDPDLEVRILTLRILGGLRARDAIPGITKLLRDGQAQVRGAAASTLGLLGARASIPELLRLTDDPDHGVRSTVVQSLVWLDAREVIPKLRKVLKEESSPLRWPYCDALAEFGAREAVPELVELLGQANIGLAIKSTRSLAKLGAPESIPALRKLLDHPHRNLRWEAALALAELGSGDAVPALLSYFQHGEGPCSCQEIHAALAALGAKEAILPLLAQLRGAKAPGWHRLSAAGALAALGAREAIPDLLGFLEDETYYVRGAGAQALGELRVREAIPALVRLLGKSDSDTCTAATALARIGARDQVEALAKCLAQPTPHVRDAVACSLLRLGSPEGIPVLLGRDRQWSDLNALRHGTEWEILDRTPISVARGLRMDEVRETLEKATGLKIDWADYPFRGLGRPRLDSWPWLPRKISAIDALNRTVVQEGFEFILEEGRIRVLAREEARRIWNEWAQTERKKP